MGFLDLACVHVTCDYVGYGSIHRYILSVSCHIWLCIMDNNFYGVKVNDDLYNAHSIPSIGRGENMHLQRLNHLNFEFRCYLNKVYGS
jgi:hypothetical protein